MVLSATVILVDLFISIMQVTVSVEIMQLETLLQHLCRWKFLQWILIEIMQVEVFVAIMQVVFSAVHYAHDYFYAHDCFYAADCFCCSYVCDNFK